VTHQDGHGGHDAAQYESQQQSQAVQEAHTLGAIVMCGSAALEPLGQGSR
jgi:hypothetical protein